MDPRISYVLDTFRHLYQVPPEVQIVYGDHRPAGNRIVQVHAKAGNFFENRDKTNPDRLIFKPWKNKDIPFLFSGTASSDLIEKTSFGTVVPYDIIAGSFYFLSGWQEYVTNRNEYIDGRFPYNKSLQSALASPHIPWVNYYFDILKTAIEQTYGIELSPAKGAETFRIAVTHDIDTLFSGWVEEGYSALKKRKFNSALSILMNRLAGRDPWFNLGTLQALNKELGITGSYYFLTKTDSVDKKKQADYNIESPLLRKQIHILEKAGAEIGIHGSIGSHLDSGMLKEEMAKLDASVTGGRFHYLYYDVRSTPQVLQNSGLAYDSTLGFAEQVGFRNAYAHPFYLYDLENNRRSDVIEIPLLVMDATLQHRRYMNKNPGEAFDEIVPLVHELKKFNGASAVLWHNSYFSENKYAGWQDVYIELMRYCKDKSGSAVSGSEIVPYYTFHS